MKKKYQSATNPERGASLVEIIIALVIIGILSAVSLPYIVNYKKYYKSEDQALKMMDLMREAQQLALAQRRTIRFEIDLTDNAVKKEDPFRGYKGYSCGYDTDGRNEAKSTELQQHYVCDGHGGTHRRSTNGYRP